MSSACPLTVAQHFVTADATGLNLGAHVPLSDCYSETESWLHFIPRLATRGEYVKSQNWAQLADIFMLGTPIVDTSHILLPNLLAFLKLSSDILLQDEMDKRGLLNVNVWQCGHCWSAMITHQLNAVHHICPKFQQQMTGNTVGICHTPPINESKVPTKQSSPLL